MGLIKKKSIEQGLAVRSTKVLGIKWDSQDDVPSIKYVNWETVNNKRSLLSNIGKIFDSPLL